MKTEEERDVACFDTAKPVLVLQAMQPVILSRPQQTCTSRSKGSNPQRRFCCSSRVTRPSKMAHRGIGKLLKSYHLRPVKSMKFTFDPYSPNVRSIRLVWMCVSCFFCTTLWDPWPILLELNVIAKGI